MEKLLFFGLTDAEFQKIKPVASRLKLHCEQIPVSMYHNTLGAIASGRAVPVGIPAAPGTSVPASLTAALGVDALLVPPPFPLPAAYPKLAALRQPSPATVCSSCASCPSAGWTSCCLNCAASTPHRLQGCTHAHKRRMDDSASSHGNARRKSCLHRKEPLKGLSQ